MVIIFVFKAKFKGQLNDYLVCDKYRYIIDLIMIPGSHFVVKTLREIAIKIKECIVGLAVFI